MIHISGIRIYPFETSGMGGHIRAYADITLDASLLVKGLRVIEGTSGGLFVAFPAQRGRDGRYHDLVVPLDAETREYIRSTVVEAFKRWTPSTQTTEG
ncbi:MAG: septation protein SpoVG family protein [Nitrospinae bacterium]|nr:septation protein SpoVG family protein [Nitrospinota bacterium]